MVYRSCLLGVFVSLVGWDFYPCENGVTPLLLTETWETKGWGDLSRSRVQGYEGTRCVRATRLCTRLVASTCVLRSGSGGGGTYGVRHWYSRVFLFLCIVCLSLTGMVVFSSVHGRFVAFLVRGLSGYRFSPVFCPGSERVYHFCTELFEGEAF